MLKKILLCMTAVVFGAGLLVAHGDPILGTVTKVDKDTVTVKQGDKDVIVMVDAKTKYMIGKKAAKMSDVKVGTKVSIDAEMDTKMKMWVAESITLPGAAATTDAKPAAKPAPAATKTPASK